MPRLGVFLTSTRPGRIGAPIAEWFVERARLHGKYEPVLVDLKVIGLPPLDEPNHPRLGKYEKEHTKAFSKLVASLDSFVFVVPEYNYAMPPALLNAFDFLSREWAYKACGTVNYGGVSGGTRSANMIRTVVAALRMMPVPEAVNLPSVADHVKDGALVSSESLEKAANVLLDEIFKWETALATLRTQS